MLMNMLQARQGQQDEMDLPGLQVFQTRRPNMTRKPKALMDKATAGGSTPSPPTQQTTPPAKTQVASPSAPQKQPLSVVRRISFAEQPVVSLATYNVAKSLVLSLDVNMHHDLRMKP